MILGAKEPGMRVAIGIPRSGKSYSIKHDVITSVLAGVPIIVIDSVQDALWTAGVPASIAKRTMRAKSVARAVKLIERGESLVIVRDDDLDIDDATQEACTWLLGGEGRGLAIHEAWMVAPPSMSPKSKLLKVARAWGHRRAFCWLDAQRPTNINRNIMEIATELRLFAIGGPEDIREVKRLGGEPLCEQVAEAMRRYKNGDKGWHVSMGMDRTPPFHLERRKFLG